MAVSLVVSGQLLRYFYYFKENHMRRIFLVFIQIFIIIGFFNLPWTALATQGTPTAVVETDFYNFGSEYEGNDVTYDFVIKNTGQTDLEIKDVNSG